MLSFTTRRRPSLANTWRSASSLPTEAPGLPCGPAPVWWGSGDKVEVVRWQELPPTPGSEGSLIRVSTRSRPIQ